MPSLSLVENLTDTTLWPIEASIIEDKPFESTPHESQKVEAAIDPVLSLEGPPSDATVTEVNEKDTVQILFINTNSDEHGGNLPIPLP